MSNVWEAMNTQGDMMGFVSKRQTGPNELREDRDVVSTPDIATVSHMSGYMATGEEVKISEVVDEMPSQTFEAWHGIED